MTEQNISGRAKCCLSDLKFLRGLLQQLGKPTEPAESLIAIVLNEPTDANANVACRHAAIIHEQIRKQ